MTISEVQSLHVNQNIGRRQQKFSRFLLGTSDMAKDVVRKTVVVGSGGILHVWPNELQKSCKTEIWTHIIMHPQLTHMHAWPIYGIMYFSNLL